MILIWSRHRDKEEKHGEAWQASFRIALPRALPLTIRTKAGNIDVQSATGEVDLMTPAGNISMDVADQGLRDVSITVDAGNVSSRFPRADKLWITSLAGNVDVKVSGSIRSGDQGDRWLREHEPGH